MENTGTENLVKTWKKRAIAVGTTLKALCKIAGIDESTLQRWKIQPPKAVDAYKAIEKELERLEKQ